MVLVVKWEEKKKETPRKSGGNFGDGNVSDFGR
jgi:hypothetical protein